MIRIKAPAVLQFNTCDFFGTYAKPFNFPAVSSSERRSFSFKRLAVEARANARQESAKIRNRRIQKKYNGTSTKPRLSVFCSDKQLYAMLVDDQNKRCLFYRSTLQQSIRGNPPCTTIEAAERVGEEVIKTCIDLNITEISSYDRNGSSRGERLQAFEIPISHHGFLQQ